MGGRGDGRLRLYYVVILLFLIPLVAGEDRILSGVDSLDKITDKAGLEYDVSPGNVSVNGDRSVTFQVGYEGQYLDVSGSDLTSKDDLYESKKVFDGFEIGEEVDFRSGSIKITNFVNITDSLKEDVFSHSTYYYVLNLLPGDVVEFNNSVCVVGVGCTKADNERAGFVNVNGEFDFVYSDVLTDFDLITSEFVGNSLKLGFQYLGVVKDVVRVDPTFTTNVIESMDIAGLGSDKFVVAWCDETEDDRSYSVYYTDNVSVITSADVDQSGGPCDYSSVAVEGLNSTHFVYAFHNESSRKWGFAVCDTSGSCTSYYEGSGVGASYTIDVGVVNYDTNLAFFVYHDTAEDDTSVTACYLDNQSCGSEVDLDTNSGDGYAVSAFGFNSTHGLMCWYDAYTNDINCQIRSVSAGLAVGSAESSWKIADTGDNANGLSVDFFNSLYFVVAWFDGSGTDDVSFVTMDVLGNSYASETDVDVEAGATAYNLRVATINTTHFAIIYKDANTNDYRMAYYDILGNEVVAPFSLATSTDSGDRYMAVYSESIRTDLDMCGDNVVVGFYNGSGIWQVLDDTGTSWDGYCPGLSAPQYSDVYVVGQNKTNQRLDFTSTWRGVSLNGWLFRHNQTGTMTNQTFNTTFENGVANYSMNLSLTRSEVLAWGFCANSSAGAMNCTPDYTLTVLNTVPGTPRLTSPGTGEALIVGYAFLEYNCSDDDSDTIKYYVYGDTYTPASTLLYNGSAQNYNWTGLGDGSYYWSVNCEDGYENSTNATDVFSISSFAPGITLYEPTDNKYLDYGNISFNFTATDAEGLDTCELYLNESGSWAVNVSTTEAVTAVNYNFTPVNFSEGSYLWAVWCNDTGGNANFSTTNRTVQADLNDPSLTMSSPANGITITVETVSLTLSASDTFLDSCNYSVFYADTGILKENGTANCTGTGSLRVPVYSGGYRIISSAVDLSGRVTSQEATITVESPSTGDTGGGGGGGFTIVKGECDIRFEPETVYLSNENRVARLLIYNYEDESITPTFSYDYDYIEVRGDVGTIFVNQSAEVSVLMRETFIADETIYTNIVISNAICNDTVVGVTISNEKRVGWSDIFVSGDIGETLGNVWDWAKTSLGTTLSGWFKVYHLLLMSVVAGFYLMFLGGKKFSSLERVGGWFFLTSLIFIVGYYLFSVS